MNAACLYTNLGFGLSIAIPASYRLNIGGECPTDPRTTACIEFVGDENLTDPEEILAAWFAHISFQDKAPSTNVCS